MGVAYRLPSINATLSVTIPAHSILISKSTLLLQAKGYGLGYQDWNPGWYRSYAKRIRVESGLEPPCKHL